MTAPTRAAVPLVMAVALAGAVRAMEGPAAEAVVGPIVVRTYGPETVAEIGRTRVIAFAAAGNATEDVVLDSSVSDPDRLEIVRAPAVLAGSSIGFMRVRGRSEGTTDLRIGGARLKIHVVAPRAADAEARFAPRIIGPATGAWVWDELAVGVELRLHPSGPPRHLVLEVGEGPPLEPATDTVAAGCPDRSAVFALDTRGLPPGPITLRPLAIDEDGTVQRGAAVTVMVARPAPAAITAGEAEAPYGGPRPERFADDRVHVGRDRRASGGGFFVNAGAVPAVCFPITAAAPGWFQMILTARGSRAQGALPTVGAVVDGENQSRTNGRLLATTWHRLAIGVPFHLAAGDHVVTPLFANDFFVPGLADRNLYLDRIEIAAVRPDEAPAAAGATGGGMAGTMDAGMTAAAGNGAATSVDDPLGTATVPLRIAFLRPLEGATIPGLMEIEGRAWWQGAERARAPRVTLRINGRDAMTQRSGAPRFWVDPSHFAAGANRIQLVARLDSGAVARTPVQTLRWPAAPPDERRPPPRDHRRLSIHEEAWGDAFDGRLVTRRNPKERRAALFSSEYTAALALPEDLTGTFDVRLEVLGEEFQGRPVAKVALRVGAKTTPVGQTEAPPWWDTRPAGTVELPPGPKALLVSFDNDRFEEGQGDRNLLLQAVILAEKPRANDRTPPWVVVRYPRDGQATFMADALVAEASDDASIASAELLFDGAPTGMTVTLNLKPGRIVFPLLLRAADPGPHEVAVRATDVAGNSTISEPRTIVVDAAAREKPGPYHRAIRMLDRFGYGPGPDDLAAILTRGPRAWLEDQLGGSLGPDAALDDPGDLAALDAGLPFFVNRNPYEVSGRTLSHLLLTPRPARARFVLWTENHFSTWIRKIAGPRKWDEHLAFTRLGAAPFAALLRTSAESPAMIAYLDQDVSYAGRLNENYAREVMELHTLGVHGGYDQADVTNLAALLTGWSAAMEGDGRGGGVEARRYTFRYDPRLNDGRATRVAGMAFPAAAPADRFDRAQLAFEMLAAHPSTARFVARELVEHYVRTPAPEAVVDHLAAVFHATGGDMRAVLLALADHPAAGDDPAPDRLATPLEYAVRLCRVTSHYTPWGIHGFLQGSGYGLFDRPTPDGYPPEDSAYTDSNAMVQRWRFARAALWPLAALVPGPWRYGRDGPDERWMQLVVDVIAVRLTGRVLSPPSNDAALGVLRATAGNRDERVRVIGPFIAELPEANLR